MDTIVFIGSNKSGTSREAIKIAEQMGYFTVLITDREKFIDQRDEFPEVHQMVYLAEPLNKNQLKEELELLKVQGKNIKTCISLIDPFVYLASVISEEMELFQLSTNSLYKMEDKTRFREELKELDVNPLFTVGKPQESIKELMDRLPFSFPLIIKPPQSNGSKDVILAENKDELRRGLELLRKNADSPILIEEYLEGPQYLVEVLVWNGQVHIIGVIEQVISKGNRFIVSGYHFPAILKKSLYEELRRTIERILTTLEMTHGSCHFEMRVVDGKWKLVEINPRISGGAMNQIILEGTGMNLVQEVLKIHLGEKPEINNSPIKHVYAQFITVNSTGILLKVTGKNRASSYDGVKEVYVKPRKGSILKPPYSMGDRYAYVLASATTFEMARKIAVEAAKEIKFYLEPL